MTIVEADGLRIGCDDTIEEWRAKTIRSKEPGTRRWLNTIEVGDVLYDVGANIGLYSLLAARRVGSAGHVYAFEPHAANLVSLLRNIALNDLGSRVTVVGSPLGGEVGFAPFHYAALRAGSSGSQMGEAITEHGEPFAPVCAELKVVATVDALLASKLLRPATFVKIDVDGHEVSVLAGMRIFLLSDRAPASIQVEARAANKREITWRLEAAGYTLRERHDTAYGAEQIGKGIDPEAVTHNLVFERGPR